MSVSQLLAQRDRALAAAAARWSTPGARSGNVGYQNMVANQYQSIQVVKNQTQLRQQIYENNVQPVDTFKRETPPARVPDDRVAQFPCINVINNSVREGTILNINGMSQLLPENHSTGNELLRSSQVALNPLANQRQEVGQGVINHAINYNQCGQEFVQNSVMTPKPEGVVLAPQGMLFPPNMIMQRPRSIPPWHQTRLNKKPVPESPVVYEKVPYIQQHMPPPALVLEDVSSRKKHKSNSKIKKASQDPPQNQPSFMENPSAYLAQQTALLHNTISRPNFNILPDTRSVTDLPQNLQNSLSTSVGGTTSTLENSSNLAVSTGVLVPSRSASFSVRSMMSQKVDQSIFTQSQVCQKNVVEKESVSGSTEVPSETNPNRNNENFGEVTFNNHVCSNTNCSDCKNSRLFDTLDEKDTANNQQINEKIKFIQESLEKSDTGLFNNQISVKGNWRGSESSVGGELVKLSVSGTEEESNSIEENPVTSSTEKAPSVYNQKVVSDLRPIQGGTVSTSNGSPQPQSSPSSSNTFRQEVSSPKHSELTSKSPVVGNVHISSTNSYIAVSNNVGSKLNQENEQNLRPFNANSSSKKESVAVLQALQTFGSASKRLSDGDLKHKLVNRNVVNVTTSSDQNIESNSEGQEEQGKAQSVTSSFDDRESQHENTENIAKGNRYVRTMASSHTASSNTITSVQAGRTQTATVTVSNNSSIPPTTMSLINLTNPNLMNVQVAQKTTKSPLEMVQSVVSSIKQTPAEVVKNDFATNSNKNVLSTTTTLNNLLTPTTNVNASILAGQNSNATPVLKTSPGTLQTGHILVSSNGQYLVASNGNIIPQTNLGGLKLNQTNPMPPMSVSPVVSNVTGAVTQVLPAVGVAQQVLGQSTVLVNALPAPFVIQPGVMAVETGLGRLAVATGNVLQSSVIENNTIKNSVRNVIPPEKIKYKKGNKKRKNQVTSLVQMASPNNVILNQPFGPPNFAVSPGGNVQPLQALTLVQGKHGQIVMNNQNNFNQFNSQPQQINLLQPVNLTSVPNFPAFQQFIVPGLGNMVMSTDGTTTILPDTTNIGVQLQLQNVNGQNVLTPVQNTSFLNGHGILTTPTGMFIRAPNNQQKIIQNNASPQFLSPNNSQFLVNQFQGQLSPLIATNLSPNQQIFTSSPQRQSPQEFIQIIPTSSSQNTTVVQQNTTIVQQQTTMVSNNQNILNNAGKPNFILSNPNPEKSIELQIMSGSQRQSQPHHPANTHIQQHKQQERTLVQEKTDFGTQHSVSTQTSVSEEGTNAGVTTNNTFSQTLSSNWSGSPPDTTTHSPVESESNYERAPSPAEEGPDNLRQAMVQYVSSSINETDSEAYLLPGIPKTLTSCETRSNSKAKNIVESSTILQETGVQIQIGSSYMPSDHLKSTVDVSLQFW